MYMVMDELWVELESAVMSFGNGSWVNATQRKKDDDDDSTHSTWM